MAKQAPFVGRVQELDTVVGLAMLDGTRKVVCVSGEGGIGKTRFLGESRNQISKRSLNKSILISDIIDFDDRQLTVADNLERRIANQLGEQHFREYLQNLSSRRYAELSGAEPDILNRLRNQSQEAFTRNLRQLANKQRLVLLFDTTDDLGPGELWNRLVDLIAKADNTLFILAGRNGYEIWHKLHNEELIGEDAKVIPLKSLAIEDVDREYLQKKLELLHRPDDIGEPIVQRILHLANGRPILIDLAVEWLSQSIPQPWLVNTAIDELEQWGEDFERVLVKPVTQLRTSLDRLTLLLSRVYPLDERMAEYFLSDAAENMEALFREAKQLVFVKVLPDERISLHDEMREMINRYVWDEVDETGERRQRDSQKAIAYLESAIKNAEEKFATLQEKLDTDESDQLLQNFIKREETDQDIWFFKVQKLGHTLYVNLDQGVLDFVELFEQATRAYRNAIRDSLLHEVVKCQDRLPDNHLFMVMSRQAQFLFETSRFEESLPLATKTLSLAENSIQKIDALMLLANLEIRLGNLEGGIRRFEEAVKLSRQSDDVGRLSRALNGLGWAYRNKGNFNAAIEKYLDAYEISLEQEDNEQTARILNNMAYINAYRGDFFTAIENSNNALEIWQNAGNRREVGITYSTRGEVHRRFGQWNEALEYFQRAISIFDDEEDREWLSIVRIGRASIYWRQDRLLDAKLDVEYAKESGPLNLKPRILHTYARLQFSEKNFELANELFHACQEESKRLGNQEYLMKSLVDSIDVFWEMGQFQKWKPLWLKVNDLFRGSKDEETLRLHGSSLRKLADLMICANEYERALESYKQGLMLITTHEVHSPYAIGQQLRVSEARLREQTEPSMLASLGRDLALFWKEEKLLHKSPEALSIFYRWRREGSGND